MKKKMKQLYLFIGILFVIGLFLPNVSLANSGDTYEVSTTILNVRSEPSSEASVIGQLSKGNQVTAFNEQYGWVQTYYGGETAWIAKHHLIPVSSTQQETAETQNTSTTNSISSATISADSIYVRSGPSTNDQIIGYAYAGESFDVLSTSGEWLEIKLPQGGTGWIASWLTTNGSSESEDTTESSSSASAESAEASSSSGSGSLAGYNIVIDPGHGGKDPGAIGLNNVQEKDIVSSTANYVVQHLEEAGANVITTRSGDYFVPLEERARISNSYNTDAFISLHYDSVSLIPATGVTTYYHSSKDLNLGKSVQSALSSAVSLPSRGTEPANYKVLVETDAPSILLELGFITNPNDLTIAQTSEYQSDVARGITNGLINYFGE